MDFLVLKNGKSSPVHQESAADFLSFLVDYFGEQESNRPLRIPCGFLTRSKNPSEKFLQL